MRIPASLFEGRPAAALMLHLAFEQLAHAHRRHGLPLPGPLGRVTASGLRRADGDNQPLPPAAAPPPGSDTGMAAWDADIPQATVHAVLAMLHQTSLALAVQPGPPGARAAAMEAFELLSRVAEPAAVEKVRDRNGAGSTAGPGGQARPGSR